MGSRSKNYFEDSFDRLKEFKTKTGTTFTPNETSVKEVLEEAEDPGFVDFVEKCLKWKSDDRMTADEALNHPWLQDVAKKSSQAEGKRK